MPPSRSKHGLAIDSVRKTIRRLDGQQSSQLSMFDRVSYMKRHLEEIERDVRYGLPPSDFHLTMLAAHAIVFVSETGDPHITKT